MYRESKTHCINEIKKQLLPNLHVNHSTISKQILSEAKHTYYKVDAVCFFGNLLVNHYCTLNFIAKFQKLNQKVIISTNKTHIYIHTG